ncbi:ester cyclase [Paraferrimonas haliotis]|nr:ester cyclase [Paraferrimonas haliotis]
MNKAYADDMPAEQKLALAYLDAYSKNEFSKVEQYYSRESIFEDKTAKRKYKGRYRIINFLKRARSGILESRFQIDHMFNSGSLVVVIGSQYYRGPGEQFGKPGKIIELAIPGVTTLTLDMTENQVKEHIDLLDYQTMTDQLLTQ